MNPSHQTVGKRRKTSPSKKGSNNTNFNSGNKYKKPANCNERGPHTDTPIHGKKAEKTFQELIDGFEKKHIHLNISKLPRAVHKPSTMATIDRYHSNTSGEQPQSTQKLGSEVELSCEEVENLVKEEMNHMQEKINCLKKDLSKCSKTIEMIQREQSDIFQRYEAVIARRTPDKKGKKHNAHHKEEFTLPPINQNAALTNNGGNGSHEIDKASMISNIKKIARKRSSELVLRETGHDAVRSCDTNKAKQTTSNEELRIIELKKESRLHKAKEALRRAAFQHFRKREMFAAQPRDSQEEYKSETLKNSDHRTTEYLQVDGEKVKSSKLQKK